VFIVICFNFANAGKDEMAQWPSRLPQRRSWVHNRRGNLICVGCSTEFHTNIGRYSSGADGMNTICCDFCSFSVKILAFFLKDNVMIQILQKNDKIFSKS
jgi:hypothetical protein